MFIHSLKLTDIQVSILKTIQQNQNDFDGFFIDKQIRDCAKNLNLSELTVARIIKQLHISGYVYDFSFPQTCGFGITLDGHISIAGTRLTLTDKALGYLDAGDLMSQIIENASEQLPPHQKQSFLQKAYEQITDKGLDLVAKCMIEAVSRQI